MENSVVLWQTKFDSKLPKLASISEVISYNQTLSDKDIIQIKNAYQFAAFEMATSFIWEKTINKLRTVILSFGDDFALEMLGARDKAILQKIPELYAINLSYELGIISQEGKMKLTQCNEFLSYYLSTDNQNIEMDVDTTNLIIRACIEHVLQQNIEYEQLEFCSFRDILKQKNMVESDPIIKKIQQSPYFYKKTIVRTLLNLIDNTKGIEQDNSYNNFLVIIPCVWNDISGEDRGLIGTSYTEAVNSNKAKKISVLKNLLLKVRGFDYVPENLRSNTFIEAAQNIISVHFAINNFYNEPAALDYLYSLGTVIPSPAVGACISALLCVKIGNKYGPSFGAQAKADEMLDGMNMDKKIFYFERVLPYDEFVINKLMIDECIERWCTIDFTQNIKDVRTNNSIVNKLISATLAHNTDEIRKCAFSLRNKLYHQ